MKRKMRLAALAACLTALGFQQGAPALAKGAPGAASLAKKDHPSRPKASPTGTSGAAGTTESQGGGGGGTGILGSPNPMPSASGSPADNDLPLDGGGGGGGGPMGSPSPMASSSPLEMP